MRQITFLMELVLSGGTSGGCLRDWYVYRQISEYAHRNTARQSETMAVMGGYAGGKGIGRRHWKIETAPRL